MIKFVVCKENGDYYTGEDRYIDYDTRDFSSDINDATVYSIVLKEGELQCDKSLPHFQYPLYIMSVVVKKELM